MNTKNTDKEKISAFADGELDHGEVEATLSALRDTDVRMAWDAYHRIGDVLRSEELAIEMSEGFASKLSSRLADEPSIVAPAVRQDKVKTNIRRFGMAGLAAAAVGAAAWIAAPQLMVASSEPAKSGSPSVSVASASASLPVSQQAAPAVSTDSAMLRDSRLDAYLLAHQRFSPALYSNAQYTRSATFAADDDK